MYLTQGLHRAAKLTPNEVALISARRSITWAEMRSRVARLAGAFRSLGLETEDRIAILSMNSDRYAEYYYATFWAGGLVVPMNIRWSLAEHVYSMNDSGSRFLVVDDQFAEMGAAIAKECASIEKIIYAGDGETPAGMLNYETLIDEAVAMPDMFRSGEDLAGVLYTGGTTGFPKGVMLPHRALWASAVSAGWFIQLGPQDRTLHAAPMFHVAGNAMLFALTMFGGSHAFMPAFEPEGFLRCVETFKPTTSLLVPTMIGMLLQHPAAQSADTSTLRRLLYGASPIAENILKEAMLKMPETGFIHAYGQTEMAPLITLLGPEHHVLEGPNAGKIRSVGQTVFTVEAEVVGEDDQELPRGEVGQLRARGAHTMIGYWNKPEQTAEALKDGWVYTGDGAYMDEDGFIYIVDRVKDMIVSGGENVFSAEVENAIMNYPGLAECAVIGIPDEKWGEAVHAIIVPREGEEPDAEGVMAKCRELIAGYKCPRSVEIRHEPLPKSGAGKIQKFELRAPFWEGKTRSVN